MFASTVGAQLHGASPSSASAVGAVSLGSERCVEKTIAYFARFGAYTLLVGRFSFGVRLFAAVLSGAGYISYRRFLVFDAAGALAYAALWIGGGHLFGMIAMERAQAARLVLFLGPLTVLSLIALRLARRLRDGPASDWRLGSSKADRPR